MPFLTASAYVHSVMIQERRGLLKVWNVFLICLTFFLTIFGTFLTRSGIIASVHSFAQSSIGDVLRQRSWSCSSCFATTLVLWRWPELRDLPPVAAPPQGGGRRGLAGHRSRCGPGLYVALAASRSPSRWRVTLIALVAGAAVFVGARARVPPHDAPASTSSRRRPRDRVGALARVHVPPEQLGALQPPLLRPRRDDVPAHQRGADRREGHGRAALLQGVGPAARAHPLLPHGHRHALRLEEDEPRRAASRAFRVAARRRSCAAAALHFAVRRDARLPGGRVERADLRRGARRGAPRVQRVHAGPRLLARACSTLAVIVQEFVLLFRARAAPGREQDDAGRPLVARRPARASCTRCSRSRRRRAGATAGTSSTSAS